MGLEQSWELYSWCYTSGTAVLGKAQDGLCSSLMPEVLIRMDPTDSCEDK